MSLESVEDQFAQWVGSLSLLDQRLLKDHARDASPPDKVLDLFRYAPVKYGPWLEADPPRSFYPEPLLRALGVEWQQPVQDETAHS